MKSKIFTKIIASAMSVMMIFSMSGVSVKAAQLQENNELKTVMVDMKDVATGDAIVYASTSTSTKTLSKDYATSTGQTGAITSIGQNVDFSSIIPQGSVIESITIYCPTGTRVTQSKYTTINNYLISSYMKQEQQRLYLLSKQIAHLQQVKLQLFQERQRMLNF